jgi:hypothetical protein
MQSEQFEFQGYLVTVSAQRNEQNNWVPAISAATDGRDVKLPDVETTSPSWATHSEALRAGVEQARRLIDRYLAGHDDLHTIKDRAGE